MFSSKKSLFLGLFLITAPFFNLKASEGLGLGGQASSQDWGAGFIEDELQLDQAIVSQESHTPIELEHETKEQIERQLIETDAAVVPQGDAQRKYQATGEIDIKEKMSSLISLNNEDFIAVMTTMPQEDLYAMANAINCEATPRTDTEFTLTLEQMIEARRAFFSLKPADIDGVFQLAIDAFEYMSFPKELRDLILAYYLPEHRWAFAPTLVKSITKLSGYGDCAFSDDSNLLVHINRGSLYRYQKTKKKHWELVTDQMKHQDEIDLHNQLEKNKGYHGNFKNNLYEVDVTGNNILFKQNGKIISKKSTTQQCRHNAENYQITIDSLYLADTFCAASVVARNTNGVSTSSGIAIFDLASALTVGPQMNLLSMHLDIDTKSYVINAGIYAVCDWTNNIHIYRANTNKWEQFPLNIPISDSRCNMQLSRDGNYLLLHTPGNTTCFIIDLVSQKVVGKIPSQEFIDSLFFSPDNTLCVFESYETLQLFNAQKPCNSLEEFLVRIALQNATTEAELTQLQSTKPFKKLPKAIQTDMIVIINEKNDALNKQAQAINVGAVIPVAAVVGGAPVIIPAPGLGESRISRAFRYLAAPVQSIIRTGQQMGVDKKDCALALFIIECLAIKNIKIDRFRFDGPLAVLNTNFREDPNVRRIYNGITALLTGIMLTRSIPNSRESRLEYLGKKIIQHICNHPKTYGLLAALATLGIEGKKLNQRIMSSMAVQGFLQAKARL